MTWKLASALTVSTLSLMCAASGPSLADAPKCEPGKLATKYPSLAGYPGPRSRVWSGPVGRFLPPGIPATS